jgi:hypothetical protein
MSAKNTMRLLVSHRRYYIKSRKIFQQGKRNADGLHAGKVKGESISLLPVE